MLTEAEKEAELKCMYEYMLDECTPAVKIGTLEYSPSRVLYCVDPIAFACGLNDYESFLREDWENGHAEHLDYLFNEEEE